MKRLINTIKTKIHNSTRPAEVQPETVEQVLADFEKKANQLKTIAKNQLERIANNTRAIEALQKASSEAGNAADKANRAASKLAEFIS